MEQDGVRMKHSEAAQGRVAQDGLSRNGRIYRIAYRKCLKRKRSRKLPLFGLRCLTFAVKDFAYAVKETRRQVRFLHDKITREESRCFDCRVSIQHGILCEDCKRQRQVEERFDRDYAAWKEQYPSKTFGKWLAQWGRGNGEQEIETEGGEGEGEGELQPQEVADSGC